MKKTLYGKGDTVILKNGKIGTVIDTVYLTESDHRYLVKTDFDKLPILCTNRDILIADTASVVAKELLYVTSDPNISVEEMDKIRDIFNTSKNAVCDHEFKETALLFSVVYDCLKCGEKK